MVVILVAVIELAVADVTVTVLMDVAVAVVVSSSHLFATQPVWAPPQHGCTLSFHTPHHSPISTQPSGSKCVVVSVVFVVESIPAVDNDESSTVVGEATTTVGAATGARVGAIWTVQICSTHAACGQPAPLHDGSSQHWCSTPFQLPHHSPCALQAIVGGGAGVGATGTGVGEVVASEVAEMSVAVVDLAGEIGMETAVASEVVELTGPATQALSTHTAGLQQLTTPPFQSPHHAPSAPHIPVLLVVSFGNAVLGSARGLAVLLCASLGAELGALAGDMLGAWLGVVLGEGLGTKLGAGLGSTLGDTDGAGDGAFEGGEVSPDCDGSGVGAGVGACDGRRVGPALGGEDGLNVGLTDGCWLGAGVG